MFIVGALASCASALSTRMTDMLVPKSGSTGSGDSTAIPSGTGAGVLSPSLGRAATLSLGVGGALLEREILPKLRKLSGFSPRSADGFATWGTSGLPEWLWAVEESGTDDGGEEIMTAGIAGAPSAAACSGV